MSECNKSECVDWMQVIQNQFATVGCCTNYGESFGSTKGCTFGPGEGVFVSQERPLIPGAAYDGLKAGQRGASHFKTDIGEAVRQFYDQHL